MKLTVEHKSFALAPSPVMFERYFNSKADAKREILEHCRRTIKPGFQS